MKLEEKNLIVKRSYKEVYKCEEGIVKIFAKEHPKSDVLNEALNTARVEEAGLDIPSVKEVTQIDGKWALMIVILVWMVSGVEKSIKSPQRCYLCVVSDVLFTLCSIRH